MENENQSSKTLIADRIESITKRLASAGDKLHRFITEPIVIVKKNRFKVGDRVTYRGVMYEVNSHPDDSGDILLIRVADGANRTLNENQLSRTN